MHYGNGNKLNRMLASIDVQYRIAATSNKFHLVRRKAGHRDRLDSMGRIETTPTHTS